MTGLPSQWANCHRVTACKTNIGFMLEQLLHGKKTTLLKKIIVAYLWLEALPFIVQSKTVTFMSF
jgi:hypothetical protein